MEFSFNIFVFVTLSILSFWALGKLFGFISGSVAKTFVEHYGWRKGKENWETAFTYVSLAFIIIWLLFVGFLAWGIWA